MNFPDDLKYTKTHEWARVNGNKAIVGITDFAQHELTDVVFVELPELHSQVKAGAQCAVVESVKAAVDIYSPLTGEVSKVNEQLQSKPELLNSDPYGEGWIFELDIADPKEIDSLMNSEQYQKQLKSEEK